MIAVALTMAAVFGCRSGKMTSEDVEIKTRFAGELAVLHSTKYRPNSKEKYEAAKTLYENVDFSFTRSVETLDVIFTTLDARVDKRDFNDQRISFTYQYGDKFIRFIFYRSGDRILNTEIMTEKDVQNRDEGKPVFREPNFTPPKVQ